MADTLTIFKLSIKSSYSENKEHPADSDYDTLQFYAHNETIWRIKTYAVDNDLHVHQIPLRGRSVAETLEFLVTSTKEHYGDVISAECTLMLESNYDTKSAETALRERKLGGVLETRDDYAFWNPNGANYQTKSNPLG